MELSQLRYFVTVAQTQHLTKAAELLHISQPALSKAISRLEAELGTEVFDRSSNRISLNSSGLLYLQYVQKALTALDSGKTALQTQSGIVSGNVSIMTSCSGILQPAIRRFLTQHKSISYQQFRYSSDLIADQLDAGGNADFAVTTAPLTSAKFSWTELVQDELYVLVPDGHPLSLLDSIPMEALQGEPLIISNNLLTIHDIVCEGFASCGMRPNITYELNNPPLTQQLLDEGRGIAFAPGLKVDVMPGDELRRRKIPVEGHPFRYDLGILKLRDHFQRPVAGLLEQFLKDWFRTAEKDV